MEAVFKCLWDDLSDPKRTYIWRLLRRRRLLLVMTLPLLNNACHCDPTEDGEAISRKKLFDVLGHGLNSIRAFFARLFFCQQKIDEKTAGGIVDFVLYILIWTRAALNRLESLRWSFQPIRPRPRRSKAREIGFI